MKYIKQLEYDGDNVNAFSNEEKELYNIEYNLPPFIQAIVKNITVLNVDILTISDATTKLQQTKKNLDKAMQKVKHIKTKKPVFIKNRIKALKEELKSMTKYKGTEFWDIFNTYVKKRMEELKQELKNVEKYKEMYKELKKYASILKKLLKKHI